MSFRRSVRWMAFLALFAIVVRNARAENVLYLSAFPFELSGQPGPDALILAALRAQGFTVDSSYMGQAIRPLQFDAGLQQAVQESDAVVIGYPPPTIDATFPCIPNSLGVSVALLFADVARPLIVLSDNTVADTVPQLVGQAIEKIPHVDQAFDTPTVGNFNGNTIYDAEDIRQMAQAAYSGSTDMRFDLNGSGSVEWNDYDYLITQAARTWFGDSNLNGVFGTDDLVQVFQLGKFETGQDANWMEGDWMEGDWDGNGLFDTSDFVRAFQDSGYCPGPRSALPVPEPNISGLSNLFTFGILRLMGMTALRHHPSSLTS